MPGSSTQSFNRCAIPVRLDSFGFHEPATESLVPHEGTGAHSAEAFDMHPGTRAPHQHPQEPIRDRKSHQIPAPPPTETDLDCGVLLDAHA